MRGDDEICGSLFNSTDLEDRVRADHPLRPLRGDRERRAGGTLGRLRGALFRDGAAVGAAGEAAAGNAAGLLFGALAAAVDGADRVRPVVPVVCRDGHHDSVWDHSSFSKTVIGWLEGEIAAKFLTAVLSQPTGQAAVVKGVFLA